MKYLLDTHALLWYLLGDKSLSKVAHDIIETEDCYYSYASLWEIAIKQALGKLKVTETIPFLARKSEDANFYNLYITPNHIECIKTLPLIHRDPFDRLLIAQAIQSDFTIITKDRYISQYPVKTLW